MKAVIFGADGQLGREVLYTQPEQVDCLPANRHTLDITDKSAVLDYLGGEMPQLVINCAGYTAVDGAEAKPDLAVAINAEGVGNLALAADHIGARLIHVSTDFVFDGAANTPYPTEAEARPLGVYGHSKLAGEMRLQSVSPLNSVIVRTSWLHSRHGSNFVKTMLRLMGERPRLTVVSDQVGCPTWARGLAKVIWQLSGHPEAHGVYHWSDAGSCSWHEFACEIYRQGKARGLVEGEVDIAAISTQDYPTPATRPAYSVLDCIRIHELLGVGSEPWQQQLGLMMDDLV